MGFLDQLYCLKDLHICGPFRIVASLSLVNRWHPEAATWAPDVFSILYHGSVDAMDFLVQQEFFYKDHFMPKVYASKLKRQHTTKCIAQKYYNALFCRNCDLIIISFSLEGSLLNNHKISPR